MSKINNFFKVLNHFKYFIVIVVGILAVCFAGNSSYMNIAKLSNRKADLQREITAEIEKGQVAKKELEEIRKHPKAIEHVARHKYFMQKEGEDIYQLKSQIIKAQQDEAVK